MQSILVFVTVLVAILIWSFSKTKALPAGSKLPPGPPGKLILGNLPDIPPVNFWFRFKEWADEYGPLFRLNLMGRNMVVVSTEKIANDLLSERGILYSSREQLVSRNLRSLFLPYGDLWRRVRKMMHLLTMPSAATSYQPVQIRESEKLLHGLLSDPSKYEELFELYASGLVMKLAYDVAVDKSSDRSIKPVLEVVHTLKRVVSPGAYLVDSFPILMCPPKWLAPFKREADVLHQREITLFRELLFDGQDRMQAGKCGECFARKFFEKQDVVELSDDEGAYVIGTLFEAGTGTTAAAMMSFCLAMCHYTDWQAKMQEEVDTVVGSERLPTFEGIPSLPTVRAVAKELWRPVTAGGLPHELVKDDICVRRVLLPRWEQHPAESMVHPSVPQSPPSLNISTAIHREEALYPDPETFNPERWLSASYPTFREPLDKFPNLQNFSAFGFGRRICPGLNIAEKSLFILTARLAWAFNIRKWVGVDVPWYDHTSGFNVQPKPFIFDLEARSSAKATFVEKLG